MARHYNPGNEAFAEIRNDLYVDKTGMIALINDTINKPRKLSCISRPRRFGKSFAAQMLCAYYDCSCDSHELFDDLEISREESYEKHINRYNVLAFDATNFLSEVKSSGGQLRDVPRMISEELRDDIVRACPELAAYIRLEDCVLECVRRSGRKFVFIIDEWDALIREASDQPEAVEAYFGLLRGLFKNSDFTPYAVAAAYMTGILPIKKDGTQSAVSDFREYSVLEPLEFARYGGFTEKDVREICDKKSLPFEKMKEWYDGYRLGKEKSIYNPYSVMMAAEKHEVGSYWKRTSASYSLETYIKLDYNGLQIDVAHLLTGESLHIDTDGFQNDLNSFRTKDDVFTLLTHLGYLAYDEDARTICIPNKEVEGEFRHLLDGGGLNELAGLARESIRLLENTYAGNESAVAEAIDRIRNTEYAPTYYNNEQALRYLIKFAYIACVDRYMKIEELPGGKGIADVVFFPKKNSPDPLMVIELKWNKAEEAAIAQIKRNNYPAVLKNHGGEMLLVGINYDAKSKTHSCTIERV